MPERLDAAVVWYVELRGPGAIDTLRALLQGLAGQPGLLGAELLTSPAQPDLALLASRWATEAPHLPLPSGAKSWVFEVIEGC
ncbi:antibiotic biosynthesis monooxygenase family protein [Deinococcus navajonensis]|uniref:Antibiotic biosynthesis monooxygenase family protein n=1 Tax=Deinococcus navajonensis TaxID=309884 RepID=A0ABV8XLQ8_9DEIO